MEHPRQSRKVAEDPGRRQGIACRDPRSLISCRVSNVPPAAGMIAGLVGQAIGMIRNSRRE
jgi:hypothetical protein